MKTHDLSVFCFFSFPLMCGPLDDDEVDKVSNFHVITIF